ncbi:MAG: c-type cytochrome [Acidobacteriota bacterium]|nr:c-type cytochrome [Acidobacteriota bacterium]
MKNQIPAYLTRFRVLVFSITVLFVAGICIVASAQSALMQSRPQTATAEKTVEQVKKNIKVLNGLPESQLIPVMNYIGASLGVKCTFCHVNKEGKWDFVSDEKPEKGTAREMIQMVQGINKANFRGNPAIGCYTCHRGSTSPARSIQLPHPQATPAAATTEASPKEMLPTADQVLAKYTEALGGSAVIDKLKTRSMKGTWITSNGISLGYEVYQTAPDKLFTILNTPKQGVFERGFNGGVAWEKSSRGIRDIEGAELFTSSATPIYLRTSSFKGSLLDLALAEKRRLMEKKFTS